MNRYGSSPVADGERRHLTSREEAVLLCVVEEMTYQEIATTLGISVKTVQFHLTNIKAKLGVRGAVGMTRYALAARIISDLER